MFIVALPPLEITVRMRAGRLAEERAEGRSSTARRMKGAANIGAAQGAEAVEMGPVEVGLSPALPPLGQTRGCHRPFWRLITPVATDLSVGVARTQVHGQGLRSTVGRWWRTFTDAG